MTATNRTKRRFTSMIDTAVDQPFTKESEDTIGVGIENDDHRVYLKAIIRDDQPHYFLSVGDQFGNASSNIITLVRQDDGSFEQRYDLPH